MSLTMRIVKALAMVVVTTAVALAVVATIDYLSKVAGDGIAIVAIIFIATAIVMFLGLED